MNALRPSSSRLLVLLVALAAGLVLPSAADAAYQANFAAVGSERAWIVPSGVTSIEVEAVGAHGGTGFEGGGEGGRAARVTATLAVTPGEELYVEVGTIGFPQISQPPFNGGGTGAQYGAPGGGATDLRTVSVGAPNSLASRLLVAAGGGGGGGGQSGGAGGDAGAAGGNGIGNVDADGGLGGAPATTSSGGGGGQGGTGNVLVGNNGGSGALGQGGASNGNITGAGGGGGGGYYGGGAGGTGGREKFGFNASGGGGGGGSSLVPPGGTEALAGLADEAHLTITYRITPQVQAGGSTAVSATSAILLGGAYGNGDPVTSFFEYGTSAAYGAGTEATPAADTSFASTVLEGLRPATTYHYRLVATTRSGGSAVTPDRTFTTPAAAPAAAPLSPVKPTPASSTCRVPNLIGKKLATARRSLKGAGCSLGRISKRKGAAAGKSKVVKQGAKPGTALAAGSRVWVVLGKAA